MTRLAQRIDSAEEALHLAYLVLLQIPSSSPLRVDNQQVYAAVRDALAALQDQAPEDVQANAEAIVGMMEKASA